MTELPDSTPQSAAAESTGSDLAGRPDLSRLVTAAVGFGAGVIGALVVAAIGIGLVADNWAAIQQKLAAPESSQIAAIAQRLDALEGKVAALTQTNVGTAPAQPAAPASSDPRIDAMAGRLDQLSKDLDGVRRTMPDQNSLVTLAARAEDALQNARMLAERRRSEEATLLSLGQLKDAIERGDPYVSELASVRRLAPPDDGAEIESLNAGAATGLARPRDLEASFPSVADAIVAAAAMHPSDGTLWGKIVDASERLVTLRRIDGKGDDAPAIVSRAEGDVKQGDLAKAAHELAALSGPAAAAAAGWLKSANATLDAERTLSALEADLAARQTEAARDQSVK
jgi:hypothetical protein